MLQRWILVHSIIYYQLDSNVVSDHMYDANCKQLVELMEKHPSECKKTKYYRQFRGFDGSTGCDLYSKLDNAESEYLVNIAQRLIKKYGR